MDSTPILCEVAMPSSVSLSSRDPKNKEQGHGRGHEGKRIGQCLGIIITEAKWSSTGYESNVALSLIGLALADSKEFKSNMRKHQVW